MFRFMLPLLTLSLLAGCAAPRIADFGNLDDITDAKVSELGDDSDRALNEARNAYQQAQDEQLAFYAPLHMQQIEDSLKLAQQEDLAGHSAAAVQQAARVLGLLQGGLRNKATAQQTLAAQLQQKAVLDDIRSASVLPSDYDDMLDEVKDLITLIEAGNSAKAVKQSAGLLADMKTLERDTMLAIHWRPAEETLDKAEDEDADDNAPETFRYAEDLVEQAEATISREYGNRELAEATGHQALRAAQHALYLAREAEKLQRLEKAEAEQQALKLEGYLHRISAATDNQDLRHMAFRDQTLAIIQYLQEQERERQRQTPAPAATPEATPEATAAETAPAEPDSTAETADQQLPAAADDAGHSDSTGASVAEEENAAAAAETPADATEPEAETQTPVTDSSAEDAEITAEDSSATEAGSPEQPAATEPDAAE
ncbi:MAG: hypothetical protein KYX62_04210 [Pseudomonadota bacterium]|nr:hypothetical protein [Pseudomonadota bacterium]